VPRLHAVLLHHHARETERLQARLERRIAGAPIDD